MENRPASASTNVQNLGGAGALSEITAEIRERILQKNYPCVAAVQSVLRGEYLVGIYGEFGSGRHWSKFRGDLFKFLEAVKKNDSRYLSFWAVFDRQDEPAQDDETEFEKKLWRELSFLTSQEDREKDWAPEDISAPHDKGFCFSLGGEKLFVVGLHPKSSRLARQFSRPALVFNVFSQFEKFEKDGTYQALVNSIRQRDLKFQKSLNPMVVEHSEQWEGIQFSGKKNSQDWQCPFQFMSKKDKPS